MNKQSSSKAIFMHKSFSIDMDEYDLGIVQALSVNARASNAEIGASVGLSPSATSRRIKSLQERGAIRGYRAILNDEIMGMGMTVFVRVTLEQQSAKTLQAFEDRIRRCASVTLCHLMAGEYDYLLQVKIGSMAEYELLHQKELSRLPGVRRIESSFAVRAVAQL